MLDIVICNNSFNELKKISLETFNKNCRNFLRQDPIKLLHFINRHEAFNELKKVSLEIIFENPELLFNSGEFVSLEKDVLALILKRDDLDMKETEIWKQLIKWGVAKHPTFQNDVKKFTSNDFETLEKTLHELIQFVRFHQINGEEFMLEVWPFRHLFPDKLIEDIFRCYLVSNAVPLYHAFPIREGNISIKIDPRRVTESNHAVYCNNGYCPLFGRGNDLYANNNSNNWQHYSTSYPSIGIPSSFTISDYEVFQVVKN
ncbi:kelch-like protein 17 [Gigaspora margarita]|uniref:Kelch-like protein 17 n=1 Tax=Gigaspora margarita TaxID=4874 RepID=A0A8H4AL11_GIGMA|nr:kelch-like protein 17 [Gigaspora margarita]